MAKTDMSKHEKRTLKNKGRDEKKENKQTFKLEKIREVTAKAYAVATKRKWLVFLIGIGLVAYFVISSGGLGGIGGMIDKIKSFF
jgi:N12 class adenine-specific DNA methylase